MSRLIFLPPDPPHDDHVHQLHVGGTSVSTMPPISAIRNSPLSRYFLNFYGLEKDFLAPGGTVFRAHDALRLEVTLLVRRKIEDWVERNCKLPAIAQWNPLSTGSSTGAGFFLWFCEGDFRKHQFSTWLNSQPPTSPFVVGVPDEHRPPNSTFRNEVEASIEALKRGIAFSVHYPETIEVSIEDETDAVEFKLKWNDFFG